MWELGGKETKFFFSAGVANTIVLSSSITLPALYSRESKNQAFPFSTLPPHLFLFFKLNFGDLIFPRYIWGRGKPGGFPVCLANLNLQKPGLVGKDDAFIFEILVFLE